MRHIDKAQEPSSLLAFRKRNPQAIWDDLPSAVKEVVRQATHQEQLTLCAYCCRRIEVGGLTRLEHIAPQSAAPEKVLDWDNLVLCCDGHDGARPADTTCDTHKGDQELRRLSPVGHPERRIAFRADGTVHADDETGRDDLEQVLNLNHPTLVRGRKNALDAPHRAAARKAGGWSAAYVQRLIERVCTPREGALPEYQPALLYWLCMRKARAR